jgi:hypothetical protein
VSNQKHRQQPRDSSIAAVTGRFATSDGGTLTLKEVASSTLYLSDRPKRIVGHLTTADFVDLRGEGNNRFQEDPPNAVLACLESGDDEPDDAVILSGTRACRTASSPPRLRVSREISRRTPRLPMPPETDVQVASVSVAGTAAV